MLDKILGISKKTLTYGAAGFVAFIVIWNSFYIVGGTEYAVERKQYEKAFIMIEFIFIIAIIIITISAILYKKDVKAFITKVTTKDKSTPKVTIEYVELQKKYQALQIKHIALQNYTIKTNNELIDCRGELNQQSIDNFEITTGT